MRNSYSNFGIISYNDISFGILQNLKSTNHGPIYHVDIKKNSYNSFVKYSWLPTNFNIRIQPQDFFLKIFYTLYVGIIIMTPLC